MDGLTGLTDEQTKPETGAADDEQLLATARERFQLVIDSESTLRARMLDDLKFYDGDQWPEEIRAQRKDEKRPILTFNRIPQFVHQVANDIRKNKPAPDVSPVDDRADVKTAEVFQGLIRQIGRQSKADAVRSYAALHATIQGRGFYRIVTDFESDDSFDQEIYIRRIKNQSAVYMDPSAQEPDYSDAKWGFIADDLLLADFKAEYPNAQPHGLEDFSSIGDSGQLWATDETIRVAEYFYTETEREEIALLPDGSTVPAAKVPKGITPLRTRKRERRTVKWCIITGLEVLERREWPGRWIPIIPILGEELYIDGRTQLKGMVRDAKDAQRQYNFMRTMQTETVALAPRAPWVAAEGQIEGFEQIWSTANTKNHAVLPYKPKAVGGELVPPPRRENSEPAIAAISVTVREAGEDLKNVFGIHDASLGARSNETSGIAIAQRREEGDNANYHFVDAVATAVNHEQRILIDLIPKIYDRPGRIVRMLGEDDSKKQAMLANPEGGGGEQQVIPEGVIGIYDLQAGRYDVAGSLGQSYATKRQESSAAMLELAKVDPGLMATAPDIVYKALDVPGAQEIAARRKKALPPGLADDDEQQQIPPAAQQKLRQYDELTAQLTQEVETLSEEIRTNKYALDSKERIELARLELDRERLHADIARDMAKLGSQEGMFELKTQLDYLREQIQMMQAAGAADADREHAIAQADADRAHQSGEAERARQAQAEAAAAQSLAADQQ